MSVKIPETPFNRNQTGLECYSTCIPTEQLERAVGISAEATKLLTLVYLEPGRSLGWYGARVGKHKYQVKRWLSALGVTKVCHLSDTKNTTYKDKCDESVTASVTESNVLSSSPDGFPLNKPPSLPPSSLLKTQIPQACVREEETKAEKPTFDLTALAVIEQVYLAAGVTDPPGPDHAKYANYCENIETCTELLKTHDGKKIIWVAGRALQNKQLMAWGPVVNFKMLPWVIDEYANEWVQAENDRKKRIRELKAEKAQGSMLTMSADEWKANWDRIKEENGIESEVASAAG
jgi:hypothetical protein